MAKKAVVPMRPLGTRIRSARQLDLALARLEKGVESGRVSKYRARAIRRAANLLRLALKL